MKKVLLVYPQKVSFIELDRAILSKEYQVIDSHYNWENKLLIPIIVCRQFFSVLFKIRSFHCIIISFGGYWGVIPTLLGKLFKVPVYIILHGTDSAAFEEIKYGSLRNGLRKKVLGWTYDKSSCLLPVSDELMYFENTYYKKGIVVKQGVQHFFPTLRKHAWASIPNAVDGEFWNILPEGNRKENTFITSMSPGQFIVKGGDLIVAVANKLPHLQFIIVGMDQPKHLTQRPSNLIFKGRQTREQLKADFNGAKYFMQLSVSEGFGVALCEAMLCGCTPIVSNVNAMPRIIGDTGFILMNRDENELETLIRDLSNQDIESPNLKSRERILDQFPLEVRSELLLDNLR